MIGFLLPQAAIDRVASMVSNTARVAETALNNLWLRFIVMIPF